MSKLRLALYPLAIVYDGITRIKNFLYDSKVLPSTSFSIPLIVVGNLSIGGTGKTPHTEYIARLLKQSFKVAVLSRGYGRKSKGFVLADADSSSQIIGDEPKQIKNNIPDITVAVCEDRATGVQKLLSDIPLDVVILDDAFQHRKIVGSLYILLTTHSNLFTDDFVLPAGNLRESSSNKNRSNIIIVTKCPVDLSKSDQEKIITQINPSVNQQIYFSHIKYHEPIAFTPSNIWDNNSTVLLVSGIVNPTPLQKHLEKLGCKVHLLPFNDHHEYDANDITIIQSKLSDIGPNAVMATTSKDAVKLKPLLKDARFKIAAFEIQIEIGFLFNQTEEFHKNIIEHVSQISRSR